MDKNFDKLASRLKKHIYGSGKGAVRTAMLQHDMLAELEELQDGQHLRILDAGGGMGQIARWLAAMGHQITLCDISAGMLQIADEENSKAGLQNRISLLHTPLQNLPTLLAGQQFDIILLHGVIEWLQNPLEALQLLNPMLKPGGACSLLYFNRNKLIMQWGINGQLQKAIAGRPRNPRTLTPTNPLSESDLLPVFADCALNIVSKAGIRIFYGFFTRMVQHQPVGDDTIALEKHYYRTEPFASLGEHTHYILRKPGA